MGERVRVRQLANDEGNQLLRIIRRGSGSVVRWRRSQIVPWSAQGMDVGQIAKIAFTSEDPGDGGDSQLQQRRLRVARPEVRRRALANVYASPAARDLEDRLAPYHHLPFST
jgi:hypothetical protein